MKLKLIASLFMVMAMTHLAFANHGVEAMGDGIALLFLIGFLVLLLSIISIVYAVKAFRKNKSSHKIISSVLSIPAGVSAIVMLNFEPLISFVFLAIVIINMMLIANAKTVLAPEAVTNSDSK